MKATLLATATGSLFVKVQIICENHVEMTLNEMNKIFNGIEARLTSVPEETMAFLLEQSSEGCPIETQAIEAYILQGAQSAAIFQQINTGKISLLSFEVE